MTFVLDASIAVAWGLGDERTAESLGVLDVVEADGAIVPRMWPFEVANALVVAERRGRATEAETGRLLELLKRLPIDVVEAPRDATLDALTAVGREHRLSVYDAAYVDLALRRGVSLATFDRPMRAAAQKVGIALLPPSH